jgi:hypothetical protein
VADWGLCESSEMYFQSEWWTAYDSGTTITTLCAVGSPASVSKALP